MKRLLVATLLFFCTPAPAATVDFQLPDLNGKPLHLSDYRGKWVVVNFWASWCPPCIREFPELTAYQKAHANQVQLVGINYEDSSVQDTQAFLTALPPTGFPHVKYGPDSNGLPASFFIDREGKSLPLKVLPSTYFVDPEGGMRGMHTGPLTRQSLHEKLRSFSE